MQNHTGVSMGDYGLHRLGWSNVQVVRKISLMASGQAGAALLAATIFAATLSVLGQIGVWFWPALTALVLIRYGYLNTRGLKPVLSSYKIRKHGWRLVLDEAHIGVGFLAACFVFDWPTGLWVMTAYFAANLAAQFCLMNFSRFVIHHLAECDRTDGQIKTAVQQALIVGSGARAKKVADMVLNSPELDTRLIGFLDFHRKGLWRYRDVPLVGHPDSLREVIANTQVDAIFWAVEADDISRSEVLAVAENMGVRVVVMPSVYDPKLARIRPSYVNGMPAMVYRSDPEDQVALMGKSLMDRLGALFGLLVLSPIMLVTALAIKLTSRGPVFFKQTRSGVNGKQFALYKFRTMCCDAEGRKDDLLEKNEMSGPVFKIKRDPRVTRVGRFLRKYSIDEVPQFMNVLRGEMSLVGPRPPLPSEVSRFEPWQHRKLSVKPGLTCLWQINGRNAIDFEEWMRLDLQYIDNWSLWLDAKIIAKTFPAVMKGSGS
ncbi:MAG: sugar transferase [bacterium]|nr:sugar transferase [bacterium]